MKFFKTDDSLLEVITKFVTISALCFGVFAYFNTVHPVFQKEKKLEKLKIENSSLIKVKQTLNQDIAKLIKEKKNLNQSLKIKEENLLTIREKSENLSQQIEVKEKYIKDLTESLERSNRIAILLKLESISRQLRANYLKEVRSGTESSFDVIKNAKHLIIEENKHINNEYEKEAISYLENYIDKHQGNVKTGADKIRFITSLPYDFKIEIIEKIKKPFE